MTPSGKQSLKLMKNLVLLHVPYFVYVHNLKYCSIHEIFEHKPPDHNPLLFCPTYLLISSQKNFLPILNLSVYNYVIIVCLIKKSFLMCLNLVILSSTIQSTKLTCLLSCFSSQYTMVSVYIAEMSPKNSRGALTSLIGTAINSFFLIGLIANCGFEQFCFGWRVPMLIVVVLGPFFALVMFFIPRTPRYVWWVRNILMSE